MSPDPLGPEFVYVCDQGFSAIVKLTKAAPCAAKSRSKNSGPHERRSTSYSTILSARSRRAADRRQPVHSR